MIVRNRKLYLQLSFLGMLLAVIIHIVHQLPIFTHHHGVNLNIAFYLMITITAFVYLVNIYVYANKQDSWFPWMNALHLTLTSITIIVAGNGMVEYHFSIFMVLAVVTFYQRISLIVFMTAIFAVHHFGSYLFMPEFAYGQSDYSFSMVAIHAVFLLLTAAANITQIYYKQKDLQGLKMENEKHKQTIDSLIGNLSQTSTAIENHARRLLQQAENNNRQSENIHHQTQSISDQTNRNLQMASHVFSSVEQMDTEIKQIATSTNLLAADSDTSTNKAVEGKELVQRTIRQMEQVSASSSTADRNMDDLVVQANQAQEIIDIVMEIARQTNLLALNAAIEASHAREHGAGFMVVAHEVRRLAEQISQSVATILHILEDIQKKTNDTKQTINQLIRNVSAGNELVNETAEVFLSIVQSNQNMNSKIKDITSSSDSIVETSQTINQSMVSTIDVSETIITNVRNVLNTSEQQNISMGNMLSLANELNDIAGKLHGIVTQLSQDQMPHQHYSDL